MIKLFGTLSPCVDSLSDTNSPVVALPSGMNTFRPTNVIFRYGPFRLIAYAAIGGNVYYIENHVAVRFYSLRVTMSNCLFMLLDPRRSTAHLIEA